MAPWYFLVWQQAEVEIRAPKGPPSKKRSQGCSFGAFWSYLEQWLQVSRDEKVLLSRTCEKSLQREQKKENINKKKCSNFHDAAGRGGEISPGPEPWVSSAERANQRSGPLWGRLPSHRAIHGRALLQALQHSSPAYFPLLLPAALTTSFPSVFGLR